MRQAESSRDTLSPIRVLVVIVADVKPCDCVKQRTSVGLSYLTAT